MYKITEKTIHFSLRIVGNRHEKLTTNLTSLLPYIHNFFIYKNNKYRQECTKILSEKNGVFHSL
jgi:hypothetical protein